jgi:hypothetical protein
MKRTLLGIALVACLPVFPQDQPTNAPPHNFLLYQRRTSNGNGFRVVADDGREFVAIAKSCEALKPSIPPFVVRFKGDVEITIDGMKLRADQLDYNWVTGEIEPLGNVHLTPVAP